MPRSRSLWMSAWMAFIFPMTEWRAFSLLTTTRKLLRWPGIWIRKSKPYLVRLPVKRREQLIKKKRKINMKTNPSIVFAHGLWADGSCFSKLIPALQAEGHEVVASQHGLDSLKSDVDCVTRCFGRVSGPMVLVGHSYGGTLITHAGTDNRVAALVYIAALAPDADETSQSQLSKFPVTDVFSHIDVADGRIWLRPDGVSTFAGDLP